MGCDIHVRVEHFDSRNKVWIDGDLYEKNRYYEEGSCEGEYIVHEIYRGRNYRLFSLLADVRNNGLIEPISKPKGVPDDCCDSVKKDIEQWGVDGHSHSYFTLRELIDWNESHEHKVRARGMITPEAARKLDEAGEVPEFWCEYTSDKTCVEREWEFEEDLLKPIIDALKNRASDLYLPFIHRETYTDEIRIVFWFDN